MNKFLHDNLCDVKDATRAIAASVSIHHKGRMSNGNYKNTAKPKRERIQNEKYPFHPIRA